jgi:hypothetical protein
MPVAILSAVHWPVLRIVIAMTPVTEAFGILAIKYAVPTVIFILQITASSKKGLVLTLIQQITFP